MPRRLVHPILLAAALSAGAPAAAGAQASPAPAPAPAPAGTGGALAAPEPELATATAGAVSVTTRAGALLRKRLRLRGQVPAAAGGRTVTVERLDALTGQWLPVAYAVADAQGDFLATWRADRAGRQELRVRLDAGAGAVAAAAPQVSVTVFRRTRATWYGPGFYGRRTACGLRMSRTLHGVAHRTLRCGTLVTVFFGGRSLTVPVIDRGPFRKGVAFDLTAATAQALGFRTSGTIGAMPVRPAAAPAP
jgi:hypothetical protein